MNIFSFLTAILKLIKPGSSNGAQEKNADTTMTSSPTLLKIERKTITADALLGEISLNGEFQCYSMERTAVAIPEGLYTAHMELSPHFGFSTPHLDVPDRTYIEIHPSNYPSQLEGCVAVGQKIDGDALDNSRAAFDALVSKLPPTFQVLVYAVH